MFQEQKEANGMVTCEDKVPFLERFHLGHGIWGWGHNSTARAQAGVSQGLGMSHIHMVLMVNGCIIYIYISSKSLFWGVQR